MGILQVLLCYRIAPPLVYMTVMAFCFTFTYAVIGERTRTL